MTSAEITHRSYGNAVTVGIPFAEAVGAAKEALKGEGFGILCEIDVAKTLKEKLNVSFRPYTILGACNPTLAHRALSAEPELGLLLPCNLVVFADDAEQTRVAAIDAIAMMRIVGNPQLEAIASEVNDRLHRVLERLTVTRA
jgi:uncharacterized protein (DUF302 family)